MKNMIYVGIKTLFFHTPHAVCFYCVWGHYATSREVAGSIPDEVIAFFNCPNHSSHTIALGSIQLLTEMSASNLPGGKERPARKANNLTAICEPIV
jgi:hypothetical protein